ncbi:CBS domain-containing protein [Thermostilla marina]
MTTDNVKNQADSRSRGHVMTVKDILLAKGSHVYVIAPDATLQDAVGELVQHNIGSLLVVRRDPDEGEQILGIITERDILRTCATARRKLDEMRVEDKMTRVVVTAQPSDPVEKVMGLMTQNRIRHVPVMADGKLVGIVSIGDIVKVQHDRLAVENKFMKDYIQS